MISGLMKLSLLLLAFLPDTLYVAQKLFFTIWACGVRGLRGPAGSLQGGILLVLRGSPHSSSSVAVVQLPPMVSMELCAARRAIQGESMPWFCLSRARLKSDS